MKRIAIGILFLLTASFFGLTYSAESAALNQLTGSGLEDGEIATLTNALRTELAKTGSFSMMERSQIDEILKEQGFQAAGACSDASCLIEMGQLLAVKYMFLGNVGKVGATYSVSVRQIDVGTGKVINDVTENFKGEVDKLLTDIIPLVASKMTQKSPEKMAESKKENDAKKDAGANETVKVKRKKWPILAGGLLAGGAVAAVIVLTGDSAGEETEPTTGVTITW